ncbi:MAG: OadG family protein [Oscillospiraceae bacterium]|nr:OadG family protein [Oscillospiraceae bacterium]
MENISIGTAAGLSLLGFLIVFIVLVLLMTIIYVMGLIIKAVNTKKSGGAEIPAAAAAAAPAAPPVPAKGSCGNLTLVKVSDRDAAMIMAITADQLNTPLNELRFISIKEAE